MLYEARISDKAKYQLRDDAVVLGIESSCDDTSAAIVRGGTQVLALQTNSQILIHREFGGVVPEIASRNHVKNVGKVTQDALDEAGMTLDDIDAIAVTSAPGLLGALLSGVSFAKSLAFARDLPLIGVNHIAGHIHANFLTYPQLEPPFLCLVASGGHSQIVHVKSHLDYAILGGTCDDAAGEALDKIARVLGLPYPGGVYLEKLALDGDPQAYNFHSQYNSAAHENFSFSGIKTAVINVLQNEKSANHEVNKADVAASFQRAVVSTLVYKTMFCAREYHIDKTAIAGGVSANTVLRETMRAAAERYGIEFYCPKQIYCTDNAAMIACAGYYMLREGKHSDMTLDSRASGDLNRIFD